MARVNSHKPNSKYQANQSELHANELETKLYWPSCCVKEIFLFYRVRAQSQIFRSLLSG